MHEKLQETICLRWHLKCPAVLIFAAIAQEKTGDYKLSGGGIRGDSSGNHLQISRKCSQPLLKVTRTSNTTPRGHV